MSSESLLRTRLLPVLLLALGPGSEASRAEGFALYDEVDQVRITEEIGKVEIKHRGKHYTILRNQDTMATIEGGFARTSRPCPPFCIQPMQLASGVETIGELEVIDYLKRMSDGDDSILLIDSRDAEWIARGTIPGAINIPWTDLRAGTSDPGTIVDILELQFGAVQLDGLWDFSQAKTLVLFCNGMWCGQSPTNIKTLLRYGYPAHKLKWFRGGMQTWKQLGLITVKPGE